MGHEVNIPDEESEKIQQHESEETNEEIKVDNPQIDVKEPSSTSAKIENGQENDIKDGKNEEFHEIRISTRVYHAIEKAPSLIENILAVNEYNKDYEMKSDNCSVSNQKTRITADQFIHLINCLKNTMLMI